MHTPMPSRGDKRMQPSTPCSASTECGGSRSTMEAPFAGLEGRPFLKSAGVLPGTEAIESIMGQEETEKSLRAQRKLVHLLLECCSQTRLAPLTVALCCFPD